MKPPSSSSGRRRAFTLVEAIACIAVLAVIGSATTGMLVRAADGYAKASVGSQLHNELSVALDRIVREIRSIELVDDGTGGAAPAISSVSATSMEFNSDCQVTQTGEDLLIVSDGSPPAVLLSGVTDVRILCFDEDNQPMAASLSGISCYGIRRLRIDLTMERSGMTQTLGTKVYLRGTMMGVAP